MTRQLIVALLSFIMIIGFGTFYNPYQYFYGFVEIVDLEKAEEEYRLEIRGDFGRRVGVFTGLDSIDILEGQEIREESFGNLWPQLSKGESYHMLVKIHRHREPFDLERVNFDFSS